MIKKKGKIGSVGKIVNPITIPTVKYTIP